MSDFPYKSAMESLLESMLDAAHEEESKKAGVAVGYKVGLAVQIGLANSQIFSGAVMRAETPGIYKMIAQGARGTASGPVTVVHDVYFTGASIISIAMPRDLPILGNQPKSNLVG